MKILHIDQDNKFLNKTKEVLEKRFENAEVFSFPNIELARELLEGKKIDLVISEHTVSHSKDLKIRKELEKQELVPPKIILTEKDDEDISDKLETGEKIVELQKGKPDTFKKLIDEISRISDREKVQTGSDQSPQTYKKVFENADDSVLLITEEEIKELNPAAKKLLGLRKEDTIGKSLTDFSPETQPGSIKSNIKLKKNIEKARNGKKAVFEWEIYNQEGKKQRIEISLDRIDGKMYQAIARDLTETKRAIGPLHNSTRALMDAKTKEEVLEKASNAAKELLGFTTSIIREADEEKQVFKVRKTSGEIEGLDIKKRPDYPMEDSPQTEVYEHRRTKIDRIGEDDPYDREPFSEAMYVPIGDYGVFSFGLVDDKVSEEDKKLAEILAKNTETAIKKVELLEDLKQSEKESEEKYSTLVEEARDPVLIVQNGKFVFLNNRAAEVLGRDKDELIDENFIDFIAPEDRKRVMELHKKRMAGEDAESQYEIEIVDSEDEKVSMEFNTSLITYNGENATMVIARDISEFKKKQKEMEKQNNKLENFASVLSHDLRNPLNVAAGYTRILEDEYDEEAIEEIEKAHDRMESIIDDILELTRNSKPVTNFKKLNTTQLAEIAWENVSTGESKLVIASNTEINGQESRILRALENLFRNAVEHNDSTTIRVGNLEDQEGFYVQNEGKKLPEETEEIFEYGYSGKKDGTGIGLSIVKNIVEAHGWKIKAENTPSGPRFNIFVRKDG